MIKIKLNENKVQQKLIIEKQIISEGIDVETIKKALQMLKKFKINIDIQKILPYAGKIIQAVKEIVAIDQKQNTQNLKEVKKPIMIPFINKYGLLIGGIAMAIVTMAGTPPEMPSQQILNMIQYGMQNKSVSDFFASMNGAAGAEFATDIFSGLLSEEVRSRKQNDKDKNDHIRIKK